MFFIGPLFPMLLIWLLVRMITRKSRRQNAIAQFESQREQHEMMMVATMPEDLKRQYWEKKMAE
jgi:hypothetical protein